MDIVTFLGLIVIAEYFVCVNSAMIGYSENSKKAKVIYWIALVMMIATGIPMIILSRM